MRGSLESVLTMPTGVAETLAASRSGVLLFDLCDLDRVELTGGDRAKIISNLCTADVVKLPAGQGTEAFFLSAKGKIQEYARIFAGNDRHVIELEGGRGAGLLKHLDRYVFREDVKLMDKSEDQAQFHVGGMGAKELLRGFSPALALEGKELGLEEVVWNGVAVQVRSRPRSMEGGFDLVLAFDAASALIQQIKNAVVGSAEGREALRVEAGLPAWGREVTEENLAQEIGRDTQAISFTKGCYLGQETVARLDALGHVNKLLRGIMFDEGANVHEGAAVTRDGKVMGKVTSVAHTSRFGKGLGIGILRVQGGEPGAAVQLEADGGSVDAKVVALPFTGVA